MDVVILPLQPSPPQPQKAIPTSKLFVVVTLAARTVGRRSTSRACTASKSSVAMSSGTAIRDGVDSHRDALPLVDATIEMSEASNAVSEVAGSEPSVYEYKSVEADLALFRMIVAKPLWSDSG